MNGAPAARLRAAWVRAAGQSWLTGTPWTRWVAAAAARAYLKAEDERRTRERIEMLNVDADTLLSRDRSNEKVATRSEQKARQIRDEHETRVRVFGW